MPAHVDSSIHGKEHVTTLLDTRATEITDSGVHVETEEGKKFLPADTVIVSVGTTPLAEERDSFRHVSFDVINVGDCKKASNMQHAIETGLTRGLSCKETPGYSANTSACPGNAGNVVPPSFRRCSTKRGRMCCLPLRGGQNFPGCAVLPGTLSPEKENSKP